MTEQKGGSQGGSTGVPDGGGSAESTRIDAIVATVIERIEKAIRDCGCSHQGLKHDDLKPKYRAGFEAALKRKPKLWEQHKDKILRMAAHAGAVASYFAERDAGPQDLATDKPAPGPVVTNDHVLMAMGVIRSACFIPASAQDMDPVELLLLGLPCSRKNFRLDTETKTRIIQTFGEITVDLLSEDEP